MWAGFRKAKSGWKVYPLSFLFCLGMLMLGCFSSRHTKWENTWWFEELALKNLDPSLGLSIKHPGRGHMLEGKGKESSFKQVRKEMICWW